MPEQKYVKSPGDSGQWHILHRVDDSGWHARCGVSLATSMKAATRLPVNEATCNTCLELHVSDEEKADG